MSLVLALGDTVEDPGDDAGELVRLLNAAGSYLLRAGGVQRAVEATTATGDHAERLPGAEHASTLTARANLAFAYRAEGRVGEAEAPRGLGNGRGSWRWRGRVVTWCSRGRPRRAAIQRRPRGRAPEVERSTPAVRMIAT